jgi:hypothetical protein
LFGPQPKRMPVIPFKKRLKRPKPATAIAARVNAVPTGFDIDFAKVTRYIEDEAANGSNADKVTYSPEVTLALKALCAQLGFERLPLTYGELNALLEYGHMMRYTVGAAIRDPEQRAIWQEVAGKGFLNHYPNSAKALALFLSGDVKGLKDFHTTHRTLETLGRQYQQFDD